MLRELPRGSQQVAGLDALEPWLFERERLAVHRGHFRLRIKQVDVRRTPRHVKKNAALRGRAMVRSPDSVGIGRAVEFGDRAGRRLAQKQVRESDQAEAGTGSRQKIAPRDVRWLTHRNDPCGPDGSVDIDKFVSA
jgi:hypothetical protein